MSLNKNILAASALVSLFALSACTVKEEKTIVEKQAPENMLSSFSQAGDACTKASCITLKKDAFGKIFLLMISGKTSGGTPQWYDLKPQVVSFERSGGRVALLAENYNSIYKEIRTVNLVQSFELVSETEDSVTFDWGQGFQSLVQQRSYDVDGARGGNLMESALPSLPIMDSYVRNISFDEKSISLEQIAKIRSDSAQITSNKSLDIGVTEETLALNVQIRAYNLSKSFKPKEFDKSRRVGFFVTKISKTGYSREVTNIITKWDLAEEKGPIVVRVSNAVPEEYLTAVTEGILYWNKVFGKEVLVVKSGVDAQAGPEDRSIMVRWIPWLDSGAAYAMGQSDPLSGETLRAQVFMPSVFTLGVGSSSLVRMNEGSPVVVAPGALACDLTETVNALRELSKEASDSQRLRLAQDSVRSTMAHEMGHALGLRHNFAGSFSSKVNTDDIYKSASSYLKDPNHQGLETSTSIMDYVSGLDEVLLSARLKNAPLAYDKMAMDWAYADGDSALDEKLSLYCTDDDIALANSQGLKAYGCDRFDSGNNPLLRSLRDIQLEKRDFVKVLFASIIGRLYPHDDPEARRDLTTVLTETMRWSKLNIEGMKTISGLLMDTTKNGSPAPAYASLSNVKGGRILYSKMGMDNLLQMDRAKALEDAGGFGNLLNLILRDDDGNLDVNWMGRQIDGLEQSAYLRSGKTLGGRVYELSAEEQKQIITFFNALKGLNKKALFGAGLELLPKFDEAMKDAQGTVTKVTALLGTSLLTDDQATLLAELFLDLEMLSDGYDTAKLGQETVRLPKPFFTVEERAQLMKLLSSKGLRFNMSLRKAMARESQYENINTVLNKASAGLSLKDIAPDKWALIPAELLSKGLIDSKAQTWLKSEITVLQRLEAVL